MTDASGTMSSVRELPLRPDGSVELILTANDLRLRGTDGDRVVIRARGGEDLDEQVEIEASPDHVRIHAGGSGDHRIGPLRMRLRHAADLDVDVPRTVRLTVRTLSGDVDAAGIAGESRWGSASGNLRLGLQGGPVEVDSMSGDITVDSTVPIQVAVRSVSGDVRIHAPELMVLGATSTSGDIEIDGALGAGSAHSISSVSGDVQLATNSAVQVEAQTVSGDIRSDVGHRAEGGRGRRTLTVGDGRVKVSVRTMSGDIRLRAGKAAATAPGRPPAPAAVARADEGAPRGGESGAERREAARLEILRALEQGDLDIDTASERLVDLEDGGPSAFRGWS
jgi:hypothetical protein